MAQPGKAKKWLQTAAAILFWLAVWQVASLLINQVLFLPSPLQVARALGALAVTGRFWLSAVTSLGRIAAGFALGLVLGTLLAALSAAFGLARVLIRPLMQLVRATPVASFIILALVWVNVRYLSTFVSFLIVLPVIYSTTLTGIAAADGQLLEMARVFRVGFWRRLRYIYLPALFPPLLGACELAVGMCWKSGVAAEVIGLPAGTIGERLYQAKIFLMTPELFAWTVVIILLSWGFGRLVLALMRLLARAVKSGRGVPAPAATQNGRPAQNRGPRVQPAHPADIRLENVQKTFGPQTVLSHFSLTLPAGCPTALMGPSGSGKTTVVRLAMGLQAPDAGAVTGAAGLRFACVFQEDRLCEDFSASANVALVLPRNTQTDVSAALAATGLRGELIHKPAASLSGGEKRRVALVRAVEAPGDVLVLDEAFKGLDEDTRLAAIAYVRANLRGRTLLLVTHNPAEAAAFGADIVQL